MEMPHVIRALEFRHIANSDSLEIMSLITIIYLAILSCIFVSYFNRRKPWIASLIVIIFCITSYILFNTYVDIMNHVAIDPSPSSKFSVIKLFYWCDGIIIILAYVLRQSYEMTNLMVFGVVQPGLILLLAFLLVFHKRGKARS